MANLAAALTHNTSIKHIDLAFNNIADSAMNILSSRIPSMKVLESLEIGANYVVDDDTSQNLARAMKENTVIRNMNCDRKLRHYKTIRYYADLNWGGRRFIRKNKKKDLDGDGFALIPPSLWPSVLSRVEGLSENCERRADVIYFLLQRGSAVFPI